MNNEELKKKILEIFEKAIGDWYEKDDGLFAEGYTPEEGDNRLKAFMADALIAAGIGDVSELKNHRVIAEYSLIPEDDNAYALPNIPPTVKQFYSGEEVEQIVKEREEYKHRAARAERALCNALNDDSCYFCNKKSPCECEHRDWGSKECITVLLRQAEKELAEEGKDE